MTIRIFPFLLFGGLVVFWLLFRSSVGVFQNLRKGHPINRRHGWIASVCLVLCFLAWCMTFAVGARLGHSSQPFKDSLPQIIVGIFIFLVIPLGIYILYRKRRPGSTDIEDKTE